MKQEEVLSVLPDSKEMAVSIREIAQALGIRITTHMDWVRTRAAVVRALGAMIRGGWVACDERKREEGHKFWYNAYWEAELAAQVDKEGAI